MKHIFLFSCFAILPLWGQEIAHESALTLEDPEASILLAENEPSPKAEVSAISKVAEAPILGVVIMVKDEGHANAYGVPVVKATLQSYADAGITHFFVYDTGSTDDTMARAQEFFDENNIEHGYIAQEPWIDYAASRNRGLELAEHKFTEVGSLPVFFIMPDAEWYLRNGEQLLAFLETKRTSWEPNFSMRIFSGVDFDQVRVLRVSAHQKFEGDIHEVVTGVGVSIPHDAYFEHIVTALGGKKSKARWAVDAGKLIKSYYQHEMTDSRALFYFCQSIELNDDTEWAYECYKRRAGMKGYFAEDFMAEYRAGQRAQVLADEDKLDYNVAVAHYLKAYGMSADRAESLVSLSRMYKNLGKEPLAYLFAKRACQMAYPQHNRLFVEPEVYNYERYVLLTETAWEAGDIQSGAIALQKALETQPFNARLNELKSRYDGADQSLLAMKIGDLKTCKAFEMLGNHEWAYDCYKRRTEIVERSEQDYYAEYLAGKQAEKLAEKGKLEWTVAVDHYLEAFNMRPQRAEPLVALARLYRKHDMIAVAFMFVQHASELEYPERDTLGVEKEVYEYERHDLLGICAWYVDEFEIGEEAVRKALLVRPHMQHLHDNLKLYMGRKTIQVDPGVNISPEALEKLKQAGIVLNK